MVKPKQTIDKEESVVGEDWCRFHVLVTIIFVSWYNLWATIWTRYLEEVLRKDIHSWLELFCPKWFCHKGRCPDWCSNINQVSDTWLYNHQVIYFNFIILFYFITIQPAIIYFTSKNKAVQDQKSPLLNIKHP